MGSYRTYLTGVVMQRKFYCFLEFDVSMATRSPAPSVQIYWVLLCTDSIVLLNLKYP